jgi:hypothetical protein
MTMYVDDMLAPFGRMLMSHMWSDNSIEELMTFARRPGLKVEWFQARALPHFDVSKQVREQAIKLGAIAVHYGDREQWQPAIDRGYMLTELGRKRLAARKKLEAADDQ